MEARNKTMDRSVRCNTEKKLHLISQGGTKKN